MPSIDPLKHADALASYGRKMEAICVLREALVHQPHRSDLRTKLQELEQVPERSTAIGTLHLCMSWLFMFGPLLILVPLSPWLRSSANALNTYDIGPIAALLIGLTAAAVWLIIAGYACLNLWFLYLKHVAQAYRPEVERRLGGFVAVDRLQPFYGQVRKHYFAEADA